MTIAPNSKPNPADPLSNPSPTPNLVPPDAPCEPLPNEPPVVQTPGAPTPVHPPSGPDHPFGPPEPIERHCKSSIFAASDFYNGLLGSPAMFDWLLREGGHFSRGVTFRR